MYAFPALSAQFANFDLLIISSGIRLLVFGFYLHFIFNEHHLLRNNIRTTCSRRAGLVER